MSAGTVKLVIVSSKMIIAGLMNRVIRAKTFVDKLRPSATAEELIEATYDVNEWIRCIAEDAARCNQVAEGDHAELQHPEEPGLNPKLTAGTRSLLRSAQM